MSSRKSGEKLSFSKGERKLERSDTEEDVLQAWNSLPANLEQKILDVTGIIHQKANILRQQQPVNWLPYLEAGLISQSDYSFITAFQHTHTKEERDKLLEYYKENAFNSFIHVVQRVCVVKEIQKFLVVIDDMLWEDRERVEFFMAEDAKPWTAFMDLLSCSDGFVCNISGRIISKLMTGKTGRPSKEDLRFYLNWLKDEMKHDNKYLLSVGRCLQLMLRVDEYRLDFMGINGIFRIVRLLSSGIKPQAQYQLCFCLWVSSFNSYVAEKMNRFGIIPILMDLLELTPAEIVKLPRIIVATFRNLLEMPREEGVRRHNALLLIQCKIFKFIQIMELRKIMSYDLEYIDDFKAVRKILLNYVAQMSSFDEYQLEVKSGRLEWSLVHTRKPFWEKNAHRLNDNKYELLKILINLLETSKESVVLCVASHDVGEYMSYYPRGKVLVRELGGKDALLRLLSHRHPVVKYYALKSLQILMLNNYDLLEEYIKDGDKKMKNKNNNKNNNGNSNRSIASFGM